MPDEEEEEEDPWEDKTAEITFGGVQAAVTGLTKVSPMEEIPSIAHISTPFFQKTVFFSKIFFGKFPSKFLEVCLNSEFM